MATRTIRLGDIAYARSGDKGSSANVGVIAFTPAGYEWMRGQLPAARVEYFVRLFSRRRGCLEELANAAQRRHDAGRLEREEHQLLRAGRDRVQRLEIALRNQVLHRIAGGADRLRNDLDRLRLGLRDAQPRLRLAVGSENGRFLRPFCADDLRLPPEREPSWARSEYECIGSVESLECSVA